MCVLNFLIILTVETSATHSWASFSALWRDSWMNSALFGWLEFSITVFMIYLVSERWAGTRRGSPQPANRSSKAAVRRQVSSSALRHVHWYSNLLHFPRERTPLWKKHWAPPQGFDPPRCEADRSRELMEADTSRFSLRHTKNYKCKSEIHGTFTPKKHKTGHKFLVYLRSSCEKG